MYIRVLLIACVAVFIYRIAEHEKRRGWLWAGLSVLCVFFLYENTVSLFIPPIVGLVIVFALMTLANVIWPVRKGPMH